MLKGILAISGHSGLFKMVAESKNSIIVESLDTKKRMPVYSTAKVSALEDIAIYTYDDDVPLKDVFKAISDAEEGGASISPKSSGNELKAYFEKVLPDYDQDRVYVSDIKKVLVWYNALQEKDMLDFSETEEDETTEEQAD
ncbi:DUF5606 family protein [Draconibacterium halophilum]|uniref:Uncharacterized protein n=1 Tax=Draconibacterium halophilum TaxID=2706887 RepID=A0A6C0RAQ2_9BACT|nr:DUF5606 domain-containing protein [Draconibacterium halophilum]QIA07460.1 hypothetical protein G0Q07_06860 [Draconibacterium halophilum]